MNTLHYINFAIGDEIRGVLVCLGVLLITMAFKQMFSAVTEVKKWQQ